MDLFGMDGLKLGYLLLLIGLAYAAGAASAERSSGEDGDDS